MLSAPRSAAVALLLSASSTLAQFPAEPVGIKVLESRFGDGVTITYKEVHARVIEDRFARKSDLSPRTISAKLRLGSGPTQVTSIFHPELQTWAKARTIPLTR